MTSVRIHPRAEAEIAEAARWYAERSKPTAQRFLDAVEGALDRMSKLPEAFPLVPVPGSAHTLRRVPLRRFPFSLVYTKTTVRLEVLAAAHMKRRPLYWIARLADIEDDPA
jgi:toxin ParE1/3/4